MPLSALFIAPFVSSITKKFGKKKAGSFALIGAGFIYVPAFVLSIQNPLVFAILLIVAGIVMGYYTISMHAYVTDVIDDFYFKRGTRKDGTIYSVYSFTRKVGQAIAGLLADVLLSIFTTFSILCTISPPKYTLVRLSFSLTNIKLLTKKD